MYEILFYLKERKNGIFCKGAESFSTFPSCLHSLRTTNGKGGSGATGGANSFLRIKIHSRSATIEGKFRERAFTVVPKSSVFLIFQALVFPGVTAKYGMTYNNSKYSKVMKGKLIFSIRRDAGVKWTLDSFL